MGTFSGREEEGIAQRADQRWAADRVPRDGRGALVVVKHLLRSAWPRFSEMRWLTEGECARSTSVWAPGWPPVLGSWWQQVGPGWAGWAASGGSFVAGGDDPFEVGTRVPVSSPVSSGAPLSS